MPLPAWMKDFPGAPQPTHPDDAGDEPVGIRPCSCGGEGCQACNGDGVIYP
ncbi:hypothetical protein ACIA6D_23430 [Streptomyces cacaoi]